MKLLQKTPKYAFKFYFEVRKVLLAGLRFLDLKNETFSQRHCHNKLSTMFGFERFFKDLKNGSIDFF